MDAEDLDVLRVLRAPDVDQQRAVGHQPPAVDGQRAQELELDRGQVDLGAVDAHGVRGEVELEPVGAQHRLRDARVGAPQRGLQARDELARPERLGHVVVGARLQRADLLVLLADRAQHEDRHLRPLAQRLRDLDPVAVGQHEVDDRRRRRVQRGRVERLLDRRRLQDLEARVAQDDLQRPQDLRLVVDDQDALGSCRLSLRCPAATASSSAWPPASARPTGCSPRPRRRPRPGATSSSA